MPERTAKMSQQTEIILYAIAGILFILGLLICKHDSKMADSKLFKIAAIIVPLAWLILYVILEIKSWVDLM